MLRVLFATGVAVVLVPSLSLHLRQLIAAGLMRRTHLVVPAALALIAMLPA